MKYTGSNKKSVQLLIEKCCQFGVKHIIISPGSRNAPLIIGFGNHPNFKCYSIPDERSAAFYALGMARQLNEPVAILCTSGTAVLNYAPALTEAYYQEIPVIAITADRPPYMIDQEDGQTIRQHNIFANHSNYSCTLPLNETPQELISIEQEVEKAFKNAMQFPRGPVHINIPFDEPLYELTESLTVKAEVESLDIKPIKIDDAELDDCIDEWYVAQRKMILVGVLPPNSVEQKLLEELADDDSVLVFTETTSNLHHPNFFPSIDKLIAPLSQEELKALQPEILITFGGMIVSKKIKAFLRQHKPKHHWHIDEKKAYDTFFCLSKHIEVSPNQFFSAFLSKITHLPKSNYLVGNSSITMAAHCLLNG